MKLTLLISVKCVTLSRPSRGAWIEMSTFLNSYLNYLSRPSRGAWIEI